MKGRSCFGYVTNHFRAVRYLYCGTSGSVVIGIGLERRMEVEDVRTNAKGAC